MSQGNADPEAPAPMESPGRCMGPQPSADRAASLSERQKGARFGEFFRLSIRWQSSNAVSGSRIMACGKGKPLTRRRIAGEGADPYETTVQCNEVIAITNMPWETQESVAIARDSGIVNDANPWATETMANAQHPLELVLRRIMVSLES